MEFMFCIPGTIGGMVYMNASAHSQSIADIFTSCKVYDVENQKVLTLNKDDMLFEYRKTVLSEKKYVVLSAEFELKPSTVEEVKALMLLFQSYLDDYAKKADTENIKVQFLGNTLELSE